MRHATFLWVLLLAPWPALAREHRDDAQPDAPAVVDRESVGEKLSGVDELIRDAIGRSRGKAPVLKALRRAREQLDAVRDEVNGAPSPRDWLRARRDPDGSMGGAAEPRHLPPPPLVAPAPPAPPAPPPVQPISDAALAQLLAALDEQSSSIARLRVVERAAPAHHVLVGQVDVLLGRFAFPPDHVRAAQLLQARVLDRHNERQLDRWLRPAPSPYASLVERASFQAKSSVRLQPGLYRGDFTVAGSNLTVEGAGREQTIIDGNLVVTSAFNTVSNLTVLGKIVIQGSQNQVRDVDYRAGVDDRGLMNKY